jgi:hypothetical protein
MKWLSVMAGLLVLLCGCASPDKSSVAGQPGEAVANTTADVTGKVGSMAQDSGASLVQKASQPLNDLNLLENRIPAVLTAAAQKGPYAAPADAACAALQTELDELDAALGPDIDAPALPGSDPGLVVQAVGYVGQKAVDSVSTTVNTMVDGVLPLRSWVRKLSGAERYSSEVAAAVSAGRIRRPFLKGWVRGAACASPSVQSLGKATP